MIFATLLDFASFKIPIKISIKFNNCLIIYLQADFLMIYIYVKEPCISFSIYWTLLHFLVYEYNEQSY